MCFMRAESSENLKITRQNWAVFTVSRRCLGLRDRDISRRDQERDRDISVRDRDEARDTQTLSRDTQHCWTLPIYRFGEACITQNVLVPYEALQLTALCFDENSNERWFFFVFWSYSYRCFGCGRWILSTTGYWFVLVCSGHYESRHWLVLYQASYLSSIKISIMQFALWFAGVLDVDAKLCLSLGADLLVCSGQHESRRSLVLWQASYLSNQIIHNALCFINYRCFGCGR